MIYSPEQFASQIRQHGFRLTQQRVAVLNALLTTDGCCSPVELFKKASTALPGLTEPTLYRTLDFLVANGFVHVTTRGRRLFYQLRKDNHNLLICCVCGLETEMTPEHLQRLDEQVQQITGFKLAINQVKLMGLCPNCK